MLTNKTFSDVPALVTAGMLKPRAVSISEARRLLGDKSRTKLYKLIKDGVLEAFKDGSKTLVGVDSIESYNANLQPAQLAEPSRLSATWASQPDRKRGRKADDRLAKKRQRLAATKSKSRGEHARS
jgi:hypothetical protein